jgi:predicted branched-subunit amino acid permease
MSCALSQKLEPATPMWKRLLLGYCITDEVFGVSVAVDGYVDPVFTYGAMMIAVPGWSLGTLCGAMLDDFLPIWVLSALSVCLYGMFISVFIPEARRNKIVALLVLISFAASFLFMRLPLFGGISSGIKIIILTVVISFGAALIWPVKDGESDE